MKTRDSEKWFFAGIFLILMVISGIIPLLYENSEIINQEKQADFYNPCNKIIPPKSNSNYDYIQHGSGSYLEDYEVTSDYDNSLPGTHVAYGQIYGLVSATDQTDVVKVYVKAETTIRVYGWSGLQVYKDSSLIYTLDSVSECSVPFANAGWLSIKKEFNPSSEYITWETWYATLNVSVYPAHYDFGIGEDASDMSYSSTLPGEYPTLSEGSYDGLLHGYGSGSYDYDEEDHFMVNVLRSEEVTLTLSLDSTESSSHLPICLIAYLPGPYPGYEDHFYSSGLQVFNASYNDPAEVTFNGAQLVEIFGFTNLIDDDTPLTLTLIVTIPTSFNFEGTGITYLLGVEGGYYSLDIDITGGLDTTGTDGVDGTDGSNSGDSNNEDGDDGEGDVGKTILIILGVISGLAIGAVVVIKTKPELIDQLKSKINPNHTNSDTNSARIQTIKNGETNQKRSINFEKMKNKSKDFFVKLRLFISGVVTSIVTFTKTKKKQFKETQHQKKINKRLQNLESELCKQIEVSSEIDIQQLAKEWEIERSQIERSIEQLKQDGKIEGNVKDNVFRGNNIIEEPSIEKSALEIENMAKMEENIQPKTTTTNETLGNHQSLSETSALGETSQSQSPQKSLSDSIPSIIYCMACGAPQNQAQKFCSKCGAQNLGNSLGNQNSTYNLPMQPIPSPNVPSTPESPSIILLLLSFLIPVVGFFLGFGMLFSKNGKRGLKVFSWAIACLIMWYSGLIMNSMFLPTLPAEGDVMVFTPIFLLTPVFLILVAVALKLQYKKGKRIW